MLIIHEIFRCFSAIIKYGMIMNCVLIEGTDARICKCQPYRPRISVLQSSCMGQQMFYDFRKAHEGVRVTGNNWDSWAVLFTPCCKKQWTMSSLTDTVKHLGCCVVLILKWSYSNSGLKLHCAYLQTKMYLFKYLVESQ